MGVKGRGSKASAADGSGLKFRLKKGKGQNQSRKTVLAEKHNAAKKLGASKKGGAGKKQFKKAVATRASGIRSKATMLMAKGIGKSALAARAKPAAMVQSITKVLNKKANPVFNHDELHRVHQGLVDTITSMGEAASPLALFAVSLTALQSNTTTTVQIPYLLTILTATLGKISPEVLRSRSEALYSLVATTLGASGSDNHLVASKAMKLVQGLVHATLENEKNAALAALNGPGLAAHMVSPQLAHSLRKLQPHRANSYLMPHYLTLIRKWLCWSVELGLEGYFFFSLKEWVQFMCSLLIDTKPNIAASSCAELQRLFRTTCQAKLVEQYAEYWNDVMGALCEVFRTPAKGSWPLAAEAARSLFESMAFVKRRGLVESGEAGTTPLTPITVFETVFPMGALLLRVLDKIRLLEDTRFNTVIEQSIVALGRCLTVNEFLRILPFNPHVQAETVVDPSLASDPLAEVPEDDDVEVEEEEERNSSEDDDGLGRTKVVSFQKQKGMKARKPRAADPWARSYVMGVLRRISAHDSFEYLAAEFLPRISDCENRIALYTAAKQTAALLPWQILQEQYWRIVVGFCHFPHVVTGPSFVAVAQALVAQLKTPHLANIACTALHTLCSGYNNLSKADTPDPDLFDEDDPEAMALGEEMFGDVNDESTNPHLFHGITKEKAVEVCAIFTKYSKVIMPKLCNAFETVATTAVLNAISSFARVCSPQVMSIILEGILDVGKNILNEQETGVNSHKLTAQRRVVLDIAGPMIESLSVEHLSAVYGSIVEPVLRDDHPNSTVQKKCYKLLLAMFEKRMKDIFPRLQDVLLLLAQGQQRVTASGMKMRLKCLSWAVDAYKMFSPGELPQLVKHAIPELVLCAKQPSHAIRTEAMAIVEKLHRHLLASNRPAIEMMHTVVAGLAGKTPMLVAGTIVVMAKLLWVANDVYSAEDVQLIVDMVCGLMEHIVPEVRSGAVSFLRMCLKLMKRVPKVGQAMEKDLQRILNGVALIVSQPQVSSAVRTQMHQLTEKLLKRFGDRVEAMFPVGSLKFVQHVAKTLRRSQRLKLRAQNEEDDAERAPRDEFAETFLRDAADGEEDDADAAGDDLLEGGGLLRMPSNKVGRGKFFDDDDEEEVGGVTVKFEGDKLMILSADQRKKEEEDARRRRLATELLKKHGNSLGPNLSKDALEGEGNIGDRRKRSEVQDFENDELVRMHGSAEDYRRALNLTGTTKAPSAITVSNRERQAEARDRKRQRFEESGVKTGDEFQSSRALGDVKKGNVDPFAYVPLHPKFLNRRHAKERTERLRVLTGNRGLQGEKAIRALQAMKGADE